MECGERKDPLKLWSAAPPVASKLLESRGIPGVYIAERSTEVFIGCDGNTVIPRI
jgi:hypothetical protein